ncbi:hypothetical protein BHE74_00029142 [Ensete ventricosum]|nr:hypothetical protein BHE74_00029142 [Ensete ventricosum]
MQSLKTLEIAWKRRCDPFSSNSALADCRTRGNHNIETSDQRDDPQEHGHITSDLNNPCMKVDFPRWEEGDPIGWISRTERYFRFYRIADATRVEIATIHLEGDVIQSKGATTVHSYGGDFLRAYLGIIIESRGMKDKDHSPTSHAEVYCPLYCHPSPYTKKVDKRRASRTIGQGVVLALRRTMEPRTSLQKGPAPRD